jgi:hypothetical protein
MRLNPSGTKLAGLYWTGLGLKINDMQSMFYLLYML